LRFVVRSSAAVIAASAAFGSGAGGVREALAQSATVEQASAREGSPAATTSVQRTASWVLIGTGGAGIAAGIAFGVLSVVKQREARDISLGGELSAQQKRVHDALSARDDYRIGSGIAAGTGFGLFLIGGALLVLDRSFASPDAGDRKGNGPAAVNRRERSSSRAGASVLPLLGPGLAGAMITLRF
jgi:hypothetical protein